MGKLACIFPGQGSQYIGMGKELFLTPSGRKALEMAREVLGNKFISLMEQGPEDVLQQTINTQPAILLVSVVAWQQLRDAGIEPDFVAGHSLGEYSAHVAAGSLSLDEALRVVRIRGELMQDADPKGEGGMAAILGLSSELVEEACQIASSLGIVAPANYNCSGQVVISGDKRAVTYAIEVVKGLGAKRAIPLPVSGPFHSRLMNGVGAALRLVLEKVSWQPQRCPVVANIDGAEVLSSARTISTLVEQVSSAVLWEQSIRHLQDVGVDTFIECGPGKVLTGLLKKIVPEAKLLRIEDHASLEMSLAYLKESR